VTDLSYTPDVADDLTVAWDLFTADIDPAKLEGERMRVLGSLVRERPGSRQHHEAMWAHDVRRVEFRRQLSLVHVPYWFADWQLQVAARVADAEYAVNGVVVDSAGFSALHGSGGQSEAAGVLEDEREKAA